jgi:hypothetical protein
MIDASWYVPTVQQQQQRGSRTVRLEECHKDHCMLVGGQQTVTMLTNSTIYATANRLSSQS